MAYTELVISTPGVSGTEYTGTGTVGTGSATGTGLKFPNDGNTFVYMETSTTNQPVVTFETNGTTAGYAINDNVAITLGATIGDNIIAGPFPPAAFNAQSGTDVGAVTMFFEANAADVKVTAIKLR